MQLQLNSCKLINEIRLLKYSFEDNSNPILFDECDVSAATSDTLNLPIDSVKGKNIFVYKKGKVLGEIDQLFNRQGS